MPLSVAAATYAGGRVFPDPMTAGEDGLLCIGGDLSVPVLLEAYAQGIFPWPKEGLPLLWFFPWRRGVLDFADLHWPDRFERDWRARDVRISFNEAFPQVIAACAAIPRTHETGTWILPEMIAAYTRLHKAGFAQSVECWRDDQLVGGLYGVLVQGVFSGESMFHRESNASKFCLRAMIERLQTAGIKWMDIQMVTPVMEQFGAKYIERERFLELLKSGQEQFRLGQGHR